MADIRLMAVMVGMAGILMVDMVSNANVFLKIPKYINFLNLLGGGYGGSSAYASASASSFGGGFYG